MSSSPIQLLNLISGEWVEGQGANAESLDPANPQSAPVARYTNATEEQMCLAAEAAAREAKDWAQTSVITRGQIIRKAATLLHERAEMMAELMTRENGKTLADSRLEVSGTIETLYYHAAAARRPHGESYPATHPDESVQTVHLPVGPIAVITPWNFPLQIPAWKIAPALMWGNTVVWKPSSETPALAFAFTKILHEAGVPAGALNLVLAPGALGSSLVANPMIAGVTFTGSGTVGAQIRDVVIPRGARLQMELGGHNAAIVLPDADIDSAAELIVAAATNSTGQKCTATRRIIAVGNTYEHLRLALIKRFEALKVGPGKDASTDVGPAISPQAAAKVRESIDQAISEGAKVIATAQVTESTGAWITPTLIEGCENLTITREEVFGPVPVLLQAEDLDDAIALANSTDFGLTASVFTQDERIARRCVRELTAGLVKINAPSTGSEIHAPFGGLAASSFPAPREQSSDSAAQFFSISKTVYSRLIPGA